MKEGIKSEVKEEKNEEESHTSVKEEPPDEEAGKFVLALSKKVSSLTIEGIYSRTSGIRIRVIDCHLLPQFSVSRL